MAVMSFEDGTLPARQPPHPAPHHGRTFQPLGFLGLVTEQRGPSRHFQGLPGVPAREGPIEPGSQTV